ncbi:hypothetical protein M2271_006564 [Streptomyces sp. LBL]|nr:hypothetical protein [Streptomyces sp. LBL]
MPYSTYRSTYQGSTSEITISRPVGAISSGRARRARASPEPVRTRSRHSSAPAAERPRNSSHALGLGRPSQPSCRSACPAPATASGSRLTVTQVAATPHFRHTWRGTRDRHSVSAWATSASTANSCSQQARARATAYAVHQRARGSAMAHTKKYVAQVTPAVTSAYERPSWAYCWVIGITAKTRPAKVPERRPASRAPIAPTPAAATAVARAEGSLRAARPPSSQTVNTACMRT